MKRKWIRWKWSEIKQKIVFKSPAAMMVLLSLGLISSAGYFGPLIWEEWQHIEQLKAERSALELYLTDGQARLDAEEQHPMTPLDDDTLIRLQEQLPTSQEMPRFMMQLADAASNAGVTLNGLHIARSEEELNERMAEPGLLSEEEKRKQTETKQEETEESLEQGKVGTDHDREEDTSELLQLEPHANQDETEVTDETNTKLQKLWADVYLEGSYSGLTRFFSQLKQLPRLTEVIGWRYVLPQEDTPNHIRVRLNVFYYQDDKLTNLPSLPELDIPVAGGSAIDILPEEPQPPEEEKESDTPVMQDFPFVPYPFVPNEDGTGFVPYPWEPDEEFPWGAGGNSSESTGEPSTDETVPEDGSPVLPDLTTGGMKDIE